MRQRARWIVVACALALAALAGSTTTVAESTGVPPTRRAQDFTFEDINPASATHGKTLTLSDLYTDRGLVLQFVASWCGPCREELPDLQELHAAESATIVLVAADEYGFTDGILIVAERTGLTTPLLFVPKEQAVEMERHYDHDILPSTYLIGKDGEILEVHEGAWDKSRMAAAIERRLG